MMRKQCKSNGYTILGLLIAAVIVMILAAGGLQVYTGTGGRYKPDKVRGGLDIAMLKTRLAGLAMEQNMEYSMRQKYIPDIQTLLDRSLGKGYYPLATDPVPLIPCFDLKMRVTTNGFEIRAEPNELKGAPSESPTYIIDQSGVVREE